MLVVLFSPDTPAQLKKTYSSVGVAFKTTVSPSSNCAELGKRAPPSVGLVEVVRVYKIGSFEQEIIAKKKRKEKNFFIKF